MSRLGVASMKGYKINNLDKLKFKTPSKLVDIIVKCLNPDPKKRCDLNELLFGNDQGFTSWFQDMKVLC